MHLARNNEGQRRSVVDAKNAVARHGCRIREKETKGERKREKDRSTQESRGRGGNRTASQIGFIVRLMKAITRERVAYRVRAALHDGRGRPRRMHPRTRRGKDNPRDDDGQLRGANHVAHRSSALAN